MGNIEQQVNSLAAVWTEMQREVLGKECVMEVKSRRKYYAIYLHEEWNVFAFIDKKTGDVCTLGGHNRANPDDCRGHISEQAALLRRKSRVELRSKHGY